MTAVNISPIQDIIADIRLGKMVILVDEEDRENEGDLVLAADFVTPEIINFMAKYGRGLICLTLTAERGKQLNLPLMVAHNGSGHGTNFTVSIEAAEGVSTGISAHDRALTIKRAVAFDAKPSDIVSPGHVFPLLAQPGGVLVRAGHTEAGCDLAMLAGLQPASVICEIMNDDGTMARLPQLLAFAAEHDLKVGTIADLIHYRSQTESLIECAGKRKINTFAGEFELAVFRDKLSTATHLALVKGQPTPDTETLVRVHEPLSVMDWLDLSHTGHSWSVPASLEAIARSDSGVMILLHRDESGEDVLARALPELQLEKPRKWDLRTYGIGAQMLKSLGVGKMRLLSPERKIPSMTGFGLEITGFECLQQGKH
ncbi:3,4-dihydroxy 2-butanone 4-phosphate synthase / GTP cyclohydrolase II [Andreprevotia lacus DSM 23236]|jgi:3,4-dihydroxy 2-butanone 4-phosphate synthase/GTP cyclohydrolase II|uniref:3,4-dihydroxy-2-butanone 4-phosphate synthase n=1 Tax=Andreprevotia lacus DSM 23236 TaxID=1121001 RepID=A0A1W1XNC8_9NEIS|nr:bifunctional 3,4-dihydroxy-2-butanone-4-phosphate synthase/GTP cyclohydrolase II [Andreprevotia lacus]SMC25479.1 3,4-dihydroxy 2-butanone 4-phosphate synthase / GTP cyclohydrolase II [Andreprevotia lacus DSM 23236]